VFTQLFLYTKILQLLSSYTIRNEKATWPQQFATIQIGSAINQSLLELFSWSQIRRAVSEPFACT